MLVLVVLPIAIGGLAIGTFGRKIERRKRNYFRKVPSYNGSVLLKTFNFLQQHSFQGQNYY